MATATATSSSVILRTTSLHKTYRMGGEDLHVLRGVEMSLQKGEWLAVLGASGSGKSTLLHLLGGLDRPDQGSVLFGGEDIFANGSGGVDRYRNTTVGFVFQFYHLLPELTALENVVICGMIGNGVLAWPGVRAKVRARATEMLERLGLKDRLHHKPSKLSGGERQRVAIARALAHSPALLLADEPTGNLDANTGGQILDVFREFHRAGQTIVMVTHDARVAAAADRRLTLEAGRLAGA
ncbi:MAG: ABC transporter ATP-binding protein [Planctomycetes bacterium]|nr:ABC transporter ATP-binding protein [Planctomycetota bacterium]